MLHCNLTEHLALFDVVTMTFWKTFRKNETETSKNHSYAMVFVIKYKHTPKNKDNQIQRHQFHKKIPKMICRYFRSSKNKNNIDRNISVLFSTYTNRGSLNSIQFHLSFEFIFAFAFGFVVSFSCSHSHWIHSDKMSFSISGIVKQISVIWSFQIGNSARNARLTLIVRSVVSLP